MEQQRSPRWLDLIHGSQDFPGSSTDKEFPCSAGDTGSIPGSGRTAGEGIAYLLCHWAGFLEAQTVKNLLAVQVLFLGLEDPLERGNGYPLQQFCLKNCMGRGTSQTAVQGVTKSQK